MKYLILLVLLVSCEVKQTNDRYDDFNLKLNITTNIDNEKSIIIYVNKSLESTKYEFTEIKNDYSFDVLVNEGWYDVSCIIDSDENGRTDPGDYVYFDCVYIDSDLEVDVNKWRLK
jgi:hypothetical protein